MRPRTRIPTRPARRWTALGVCLAACVTTGPASAAPPSAPGVPELTIDATPLLGTGATVAVGWNEVVVSVQNNGGKPARGTVEVSGSAFGRERHEFRATAPFSVGAGTTVNVRVPAMVTLYTDLQVEVVTEDGIKLSTKTLSAFVPPGVTLLDVSETSRLRGAVNDAVVTPLLGTSASASRGSAPTLAVTSPRFDPATGDPVLPDRAALYSSADAVLMRSDVLARLAGPELDALAGYVLGGGTLAVAVVRPEDVRSPTLTSFAGGSVSRQGVFAATLADLVLPVPASSGGSTTKLIPRTREPTGELAETLAGYAGGNLHGSLYGSSAAYGLGEVHLLAFDPTHKPAVDDPWAQARVVDLARRAFDRRSTLAFRPGVDASGSSYNRVRQQLDPNESSRWAIAAAALLLIFYAVLAGPVSFSLAARAGRPLRALRRLPLFSAAAFALVVLVGFAAKGIGGRARHLTLVEAGAGMPKGSARRFRGFYASRAKELTVRTTDGSSLVSTAVADAADRRDHLLVDRDGARLVELAALPWQTVVVREDGFASLGDGVALVKDARDAGAAGAAVTVINRSGKDLRGAILRVPGGSSYYLARIKDGDRVSTAALPKMSADADGRVWESMVSPSLTGGIQIHHLGAPGLHAVLDADAPGLSDAWQAMSDAVGDSVDWFPESVPVLIGQLDGGEGRLTDSGLRLEKDRVLVRVVGYGGRP